MKRQIQTVIGAFLLIILLPTVQRTEAATFRLKAVAINDVPVTPTDHVTVEPNDTITVEAYVSGWNEDEADSQLRTYQFTIDGANSLFSGESGRLSLRGVDPPAVYDPCIFDEDCTQWGLQCSEGELGNCVLYCTNDGDCPSDFPTCYRNYCFRMQHGIPNLGTCAIDANCGAPNRRCAHFEGVCGNSCMNDADCPADFPICENPTTWWHRCVTNDHEPTSFNLIDRSRADFVHRHFMSISAVRHATINPVFGSTTLQGDGPANTTAEWYMGELGLIPSSDACGTFAVIFVDDRRAVDTFIIVNPSGYVYFPEVVPLLIDVACLPRAACCVPRQSCTDRTQNDCLSRGGTWQTGTLCNQNGQECPRFPRIRTVGPN
jgi:hypothetical protein